MEIELTINEDNHFIDVEPYERLIDTLRIKLGLTGIKEGCGEGECGACTVLMEGQAVNACMILSYQARGKSICTIEGLALNDELDPIQTSFIKYGAIQCGYCTPGMITTAKALILENPYPSGREIKEAIAGNLCRCTGYVNIVHAIKAATQNNPKA